MIQTGAFDTDLVEKQPGPPIVNEFKLSNVRGTLAMAKQGSDPDSATSQFFINQNDNSANLDNQNGGFTVFAQVIQGMDIVDIIVGVRAYWQYSPSASWIGDVPSDPVIIEKAEIYDPATRVYVSTSGSDSAGTGTYLSPYATIQKAFDTALPNAHIVLFPGTYTGNGNRDILIDSYMTILRGISPADSATVASTIIDCQATAQDMHRAFILNSNVFPVTIKGLTITNGYHNDGAAIFVSDSDLYLENCSITGNTAVSNGGAVYFDNADSVIEKTIMQDNSAMNGGALYNKDSSLEINHSRLLNNSASNGAAIYSDNDPSLTVSLDLKNIIIAYNNVSVDGGGIYQQNGSMSINNCNVVYNNAASLGTAIYDAGTTTVKNSIIYGTASSIIHGSPDVTYSDVQGGFGGLGNIDVDPMFVDAAAGNYHLQCDTWRWRDANAWWQSGDTVYTQPWNGGDLVTSRCVDGGDPCENMGQEPDVVLYDLFIAQPYGVNKRVNMGAYGGTKEASMPPFDFAYKSDYNNDGAVDAADLTQLADFWSSIYDMSDFLTVSQEWQAVTSWYVP